MTAPEARIAAALDEIRDRIARLDEDLASRFIFAGHRGDLEAHRAALVAVRERLE